MDLDDELTLKQFKLEKTFEGDATLKPGRGKAQGRERARHGRAR